MRVPVEFAAACRLLPAARVLLASTLPCLLLLSAGVRAATDPTYDLLLFDPVPVELAAGVIDPKSGATPDYAARELDELPKADAKPVLDLVNEAARQLVASDRNASPEEVPALEGMLKQIEQDGNAYDHQLTETLLDLASAHEKNGEYSKALTLYERANHIVRVNNGLFSLQQEPLIRRMIGNHLAMGDIAAADSAQSYLFYLRSKVHGRKSPEMVSALQDLAQWNITAYRMEAPGLQGLQGPDGEPARAAKQASASDILVARLNHIKTANDLHVAIMRLMQEHPGSDPMGLSQAEYQFAVSNFLFTRLLLTLSPPTGDAFNEPAYSADMQEFRSSYAEGRKALENRIKRLAATRSATPADLAHARLDLADWLIATNNRGELRAVVEKAHADYVASGADPADVDKLFNPALPTQVPPFVINAYTRQSLAIPADAAIKYRGYIDMQFDVSAFGESGSTRVIYSTPDTPPRVIDLLTRTIRRNQYRPHIVDGKLAPYEKAFVRYYYTW